MSGSTSIPNKVLLRADEVADVFGVCVVTVYRWKWSGKLPAVKSPGRALRFRRDDIVKLFENEE